MHHRCGSQDGPAGCGHIGLSGKPYLHVAEVFDRVGE